MEPQPVINHVAQKTLLGTFRRVAPAAYAASVFTTCVASQGERGFIEPVAGVVIVLDLDAVIGVIPYPAGVAQGGRPQSVLIAKNRQPAIRAPENLASDPEPLVEPSVGRPQLGTGDNFRLAARQETVSLGF